MIASGDVDDLGTRRLELAMPAFREWPAPEPDRDDWAAWQELLGSARARRARKQQRRCAFASNGYGTVSSALIALPARSLSLDRHAHFRFAGWCRRLRRGRM